MSNSTSWEITTYVTYTPTISLTWGSIFLVSCFFLMMNFQRLSNRLVKGDDGKLHKLVPTHPMARSHAVKATVQFVPLENDSGKLYNDPVNVKQGLVVKLEDAINIDTSLTKALS